MQWYSPIEALARLKYSKDTLRSLIKDGVVPCTFEGTKVLVGIDYEKVMDEML